MKINPKSEKGAITLVVIVAMLFLTTFLMSLYIGIANKARISAETTKQIAEKYNNIDEVEAIYDSYFADTDIIPIYTREHLEKIGSGQQVEVNGKIYNFSSNAYYTLKNDIDLGGYYDESTETWVADKPWTPLPSTFTGVLDGLGNTIIGLYINNTNASKQGLFGTLKGTVKNLNILGSYVKAKDYVGAIAGLNEGTIENCNNKATVTGTNYVGGIAGNLTENIVNCYNTGNIIADTNVTGGYFKSITTGEIIEVWSDRSLTENAYFVSGSYRATAPRGFKVSKNVFEQTIEDGMVIQDKDGNEFVWIPVKVTSTDTPTKIASFYRSEWSNNTRSKDLTTSTTYIEPYTQNEWEVKEYEAMVSSVYKNNGFYIGRYEAGCDSARFNKRSNNTSNMGIKKDLYPYDIIGWGSTMSNYEDDIICESRNQGKGAVYLSKNMYPESRAEGVISTLCYGIQWDAMLDFIKEEKNVTSCLEWGNYQDVSYTLNRRNVKYIEHLANEWSTLGNVVYQKNKDKQVKLSLGALENFKAKNIYDVAGNLYEWTMEVQGTKRVARGGHWYDTGATRPASYRSTSYLVNEANTRGFRVALYIK